MLVIRLKRTGKRNDATFRIVVAQKHAAVKGKVLEVIGHYIPTKEPVIFECNTERVTYWMDKGAQPSNTLSRLLKKQGMDGLDKFIETYTKKNKRKVSEEDEAAPAAPAADAKAEDTSPKPEKPKEKPEETSPPTAEDATEEAPEEKTDSPSEETESDEPKEEETTKEN